jgi:hypothetical protein
VFRLLLRTQKSETRRRQGDAEDSHGEKGAAGSRLTDERRFPREPEGPASIGRHWLPPVHENPRRLSVTGTRGLKPRNAEEFANDKKEEAGQGEERTEPGRVENPAQSTASHRVVASRVEIAVGCRRTEPYAQRNQDCRSSEREVFEQPGIRSSFNEAPYDICGVDPIGEHRSQEQAIVDEPRMPQLKTARLPHQTFASSSFYRGNARHRQLKPQATVRAILLNHRRKHEPD